MSVTTYKNNNCRYRLDKLDKVVYLISEDALKNIHVDNGQAYIDEITEEPLSISVYNIELKDTDELDERYKFTHTLTFSVQDYANYHDFEGKYYAIVKSLDGEYWMVNPMFPCKVTYTYTLDGNGSHTDFTLSTSSNFPTMIIHNIEHTKPYECGYRYCRFEKLRLNETKYSLRLLTSVLYTNNGFKDVLYDKNSASFVEQFDGKNVSHTLTFNIKFDNYKASWHYNLLEFTENIYAAIIDTSCNNYITCGFGFGLHPSFTVSAADNQAPNNIQIQLSDMHDNGDFIWYTDDINVSGDTSTTYQYTTEGAECVGNNIARYILMREVDALLNPTGNYKALEGYQYNFPDLNIVGTFNETETFKSYLCTDKCKIQTSFPVEFTFNTQTCREYTILGDSDWSISPSANYITVSPISGVAGVSTTVQVCNTQTPTETPLSSLITLNYCGKSNQYGVTVVKADGCLPSGSIFDISANEQYVIVPTACCVSGATSVDGSLTNIEILNNYIKVFVTRNDTSSPRQFTIDVLFCDGTNEEVIINQGTGFERWVKEDTGCTNQQKCDIERKYTGVTADDINTYTEETRYTNCVDSLDCVNQYSRWIEIEDTTCYGGNKYTVLAEQKSLDGGNVWFPTGNKKLGEIIDDPEGDCEGVEEYEEWREDGTICNGTSLYKRLRLYTSVDGINWVETDHFKRGDLIEINSTECGYTPPTPEEQYVEWRADGFMCDGFDKYVKYVKWVSPTGNEGDWTETDIFKLGDEPVEVNSEYCGYVPTIQYDYQWVLTTRTRCVGPNKYYLYKQQRRRQNTQDAWEDVIPTEYSVDGGGTMPLSLAEANSSDCGYVPPIEPRYRWVVMDINSNWYCADCEGSTSEQPKIEFRIGDGELSSITCNNSTILSKADISNSTGLTYAKVGTCVTSIGDSVFDDNENLSQVLLPSSVTSIGSYAFAGCTSLIDFSMPNSITSIGSYAFQGCTQLNKINLPNSLTSIGEGAFTYCKNFQTINIPNGVTSIPYQCFYDCDGITDVYLPSGITSIGYQSFVGCNGFVNLTVYATTPPTFIDFGTSHISNYLGNSLQHIYVPTSSVNAYKTATGWSSFASIISAIS